MENVRHALTLGQGDMLRITDGRGLLVHVAQGQVWLTQERDYRDIVLTGGESFRLERAGLALIYALEAAALSVCAPRERKRAEPAGTLGVVPARAGWRALHKVQSPRQGCSLLQLANTIAHWCMLVVLVCVVAGLVSGYPADADSDGWLTAQAAGLSMGCIPGSTLHRPLGTPAGVFGSMPQPVPGHTGRSGTHVRSLLLSGCSAATPFMRWQSLS